MPCARRFSGVAEIPVALVIDAGGLYAQADRAGPAHAAVAGTLRKERGPLVASEVAVAEADYLIWGARMMLSSPSRGWQRGSPRG
jgi:hypothetical protein